MENPNNALYHYGVKGMKWGVIREKLRLGRKKKRGDRDDSDDDKPSTGKSSSKDDSYNGGKISKSVGDMDDRELTLAINRLRMEQTFNQLHDQVYKPAPKEQTRMSKLIDGLKDSAVSALTEGSKAIIKEGFTKAAKKALNLDDAGMDTADEMLKQLKKKADILNTKKSISEAEKYFENEAKPKDAELEGLKASAEKAKYASQLNNYMNKLKESEALKNIGSTNTPVKDVKVDTTDKQKAQSVVEKNSEKSVKDLIAPYSDPYSLSGGVQGMADQFKY